MKLRHAIILTAIVLLLTACNFSLAADVTPPPNYVPPTTVPTQGPQFPANTPDLKNGESIYATECLPCHGSKGLGDGPLSGQLQASVPAIGLPDTAQKAQPSAWYIKVTQGNIQKFMPPFSDKLSDQQRWDVVAYAFTLHTNPDQIAQGKSLFETNCADCASTFSNQQMMSVLSENDLIKLMKEGQGKFPPFGKNFTDTEASAVAAYLRTLTFGSLSAPVAVAATETPASAETGTPSAGTTPVDGTQAAVTPEAGTPQANVTGTAQTTVVAAFGKVSGSIDNQTGKALPSGIKITLRAYEHGADTSTAPTEINTTETTANADGTFAFENIELPANRIFIAEATVNGQTYKSEFVVVKAGDTKVVLTPIKIFVTSSDFSKLTVNQAHIFLDVKDGTLQVVEFFNILNSTGNSILIPVVDGQMAIAKLPANMTNLGFDAQQGEAIPIQTTDGFALPPSDKLYGIIAGFEMPYDKSANIEIPFVLDIPSGSALSTIGIKLEGSGFVDKGPMDIGSGTMYQVYEFGEFKPGSSLKIKLSGQPAPTPVTTTTATTTTTGTKSNTTLLIGVGAFGVVLIIAGLWLFLRDRKRGVVVEKEEDEEFDDPESLMDAIIALDDLHRAGKLSDEAYQKRRDELKNALKRKS